MDRRKRFEEEVFTFSPRISTASRKIVSKLREINKVTADRDSSVKSGCKQNSANVSSDLKGEHTLLKIKHDIKCRLLQPIDNDAAVPSKKIDSPTIICSTTLHLQAQKGKGRITLPSMNLTVHANQGKLKLHNSVPVGTGAKSSALPNSGISKNDVSSLKVYDENVFTFRPKVSSASVRIAETLGTDFMTRQQQHIENQKRYIEQASMHQKNSVGRLSPMGKGKKSKKEGEDIGESPSSTGLDGETGQGEGRLSGNENIEIRDHVSSPTKTRSNVSPNLQRLLEGPYANGNADMILKKNPKRLQVHQPKRKHSSGTGSDSDDKENADLFVSTRSKTMPHLGRPKLSRKLTTLNLNGDRLRIAKDLAEKAIKLKKIFTIQGGYATVRHSLRARGWIEKFYQIPKPVKKPRAKKKKPDSDNDDDNNDDDDDDNDDDDDDNTDSDNDEPKIPPWEEDDGLYGIMSRMVRNVNPTFIWVLKRDAVDYKYLVKDQMVNHYCRAGSFTTKVGLCVNMRNVPWFHSADPDTFFPRCFRLGHEDDKPAFIDDYRLTACMGLIQTIVQQNSDCLTSLSESQENSEESNQTDSEKAEKQSASDCVDPKCTRSRPNSVNGNKCIHVENKTNEPASQDTKKSSVNFQLEQSESPRVARSFKRKQKQTLVPLKALEIAMQQIEKYLQSKDHTDIDIQGDPHSLSESQWDDFIQWYYQVAHHGGFIQSVPKSILSQCEFLISRLRVVFPQFEMNGTKNVWIVKPGAKSRGRGIVCLSKLEDMLKLVSCSVVNKEGKFVVQKYIERPLLIYNTKFDIRQWILVTDWNPLTIWFYKDSYLRFCSQQFTLDDFDEAIHLSNNAIQKHYKNGPRSESLPKDNMWSHFQFIDYMKSRKVGHLWEEMIYPGMKKAITCALLSTQDLVECRKSSFELYGADFMLTEDYQPWLIEINSSPTMESSTAITTRLCSSVLEDTVKVAVDRKYDRNCDIGRFELAYKQSLVTVPPYIGISLQVEGQAIKRPGFVRKTNDSEMMFTPRINIRQSLPSERTEQKNNSTSTGSTFNNKHNQDSSKSAPVHTSKSSNNQDHSKGTVSSSASKCSVAGKKTPNSNVNHSNLSGSNSNSGVHHSVSTGNQSHSGGIKLTSSSHHSVLNSISKHSSLNENDSASGEGQEQKPVAKTDVSPSASGTLQNRSQKQESGASLPPSVASAQPPMKPIASIQIPAMSTTGKKIVSTTSVSNSYPVPALLNKMSDRIGGADETEGKCVKQTKGVNPLIDGSWARTCNECGAGMNLQLENANVNCKCRQDSIMIFAEPILPENIRNSSISKSKSPPKSESSKGQHQAHSCGGLLSPPGIGRTDMVSPSGRNERILLRYTDAGIQRPVTPHSVVTSQLPKIVKRYIARRNTAYSETAYGASSVYLDTSKVSNPLSIVSQNYHR